MDASTAKATFLEQLPLIERLIATTARRFRLSSADSEDFGSSVRLRLMDRDYEVLRKFRGASSLQTFLTVVIVRCGLDYCAARYGRWRPSARVRRLGPEAVALAKLIVHRGMTSTDAQKSLGASSGTHALQDLEPLWQELAARPRRVIVDDIDLDTLPARPARDRTVDVTERRRVSAALRTALATLGEQDRRLLKWRYQERLTVTEIARRGGIERARLYRYVERLLRRLRTELEGRGVTLSDVRQIIDSVQPISLMAPDRIGD